jgi:hypothetical protein
MHTNHRHYTLLLMAIVTTVVSVCVYLILHRTIVSQAKEATRAKAEELALQHEKQYETDINKTYTNSAEERAKISSYIVSQEKILDFIEAIEGIGTTTGASLDISDLDTGNFSTQSSALSSESIENLKIHIEIHGSWVQVMQALMLLENIPYSLSLHNIQLIRLADETSATPLDKKISKTPLWKASIDIKTLITK